MKPNRFAVALFAMFGAAALVGCPVPSFMNKDKDAVASGGPAGPGGQVPVNTVTMTGASPFGNAAAAPAPSAPGASAVAPKPPGGKKGVRYSYLENGNQAYPGYGRGTDRDGMDGLADMDVYASTQEGLLRNNPDFYPAGPGAMGGIAVDLNPNRYREGVYGNPENLASRIGSADDLTGLMQMSYTTHGGDHNVTLTRDGLWMVYASTRWGKNPQLVRQRVGATAVQRLTQSTASDMMPAVSPDNQVIVWTSNRFGAWNLLARELEAPPQAAPQQLTRSDADDLHPTWSHDGKLLAFSRYNAMDGQWELWVMDFARRIVTCVGPGLFPSFSPVAKRYLAEDVPVYTIAYQNHRQRDIPFYSIWTLDVAFRHGKVEAVGAPTEVVSSSDWAAITPAWSPDGEYLAFATVRRSPLAQMQGRIYRGDEIAVVRVDGSELTTVTNHAAPDWYPYWAAEEGNPVGRLYFTSSRNGYPNIWSVRPSVEGQMMRLVRRGAMAPPR